MLWIWFLCSKTRTFLWQLTPFSFLNVYDTTCHTFLNSSYLSQQEVWCRDRWGTIQVKAEKKLPPVKKVLYTAAGLMFPCSQKMLFGVRAEQFPVQAAVGQWMSQTASVQLLQCGVDGTRSYSSPPTPGKCTETAPSGLCCAPSCLPLSLPCVMGRFWI